MTIIFPLDIRLPKRSWSFKLFGICALSLERRAEFLERCDRLLRIIFFHGYDFAAEIVAQEANEFPVVLIKIEKRPRI